MLFYLLSRIASAAGAFVYPAYASYKTLSRRPASEVDVERWLMYWSVLGTIVGLEYVAEWTISWIPFYHEFKTLFLLYLALPQTRGASYVYKVHLHPFISKHEVEIDDALGRVKEEVWRWIMLRVRGLWDNVAMGEPPRDPDGGRAGQTERDARAEQQVPPSVPTQLAYSLWQTYGPALAAFLNPPPSTNTHPSPTPSPSTTTSRVMAPPSSPPVPDQFVRGTTSALDMHPDAALLARRRALEAELSTLPLPLPLPNPYDGVSNQGAMPAFPIAQPAAAFSAGMSASSSHIPRPASSTYLSATAGDERGRYEEIGRDEVDSDDDDGDARMTSGADAAPPAWSQWLWGGGSKGAYERVKTE